MKAAIFWVITLLTVSNLHAQLYGEFWGEFVSEIDYVLTDSMLDKQKPFKMIASYVEGDVYVLSEKCRIAFSNSTHFLMKIKKDTGTYLYMLVNGHVRANDFIRNTSAHANLFHNTASATAIQANDTVSAESKETGNQTTPPRLPIQYDTARQSFCTYLLSASKKVCLRTTRCFDEVNQKPMLFIDTCITSLFSNDTSTLDTVVSTTKFSYDSCGKLLDIQYSDFHLSANQTFTRHSVYFYDRKNRLTYVVKSRSPQSTGTIDSYVQLRVHYPGSCVWRNWFIKRRILPAVAMGL